MKLLESCMKCYVRYIHPQVVEFNLSRAFLYQNINKACIKSFLVSKPSHETDVLCILIFVRAHKNKLTHIHQERRNKKVCVCERENLQSHIESLIRNCEKFLVTCEKEFFVLVRE